MQQRKAVLGKSAQYLYNRIAEGKPLPPTMRRGSPEYIKCSYWTTLNQRCVNGLKSIARIDSKRNDAYLRKSVELLLSKERFDQWVDENWQKFASLYAEGKTPSIDRMDSTKGYEPGNMQVIDLKTNMRKDRTKPVIGTSIFDGSKKRYECAKDASVDGFDYKLISRACLKGMNHKGFAWAFESECRPSVV